MRLCLSAGLAFLLALPAGAQELAAVPETDPLPATIEEGIQDATQDGEIVDRILRWEGDLTGDSAPDQLVQVAFANSDGGNAIWLRHWIFENRGGDYISRPELTNLGPVNAARREGTVLVLTIATWLADDARCCPSGSEEVRVPLD